MGRRPCISLTSNRCAAESISSLVMFNASRNSFDAFCTNTSSQYFPRPCSANIYAKTTTTTRSEHRRLRFSPLRMYRARHFPSLPFPGDKTLTRVKLRRPSHPEGYPTRITALRATKTRGLTRPSIPNRLRQQTLTDNLPDVNRTRRIGLG